MFTSKIIIAWCIIVWWSRRPSQIRMPAFAFPRTQILNYYGPYDAKNILAVVHLRTPYLLKVYNIYLLWSLKNKNLNSPKYLKKFVRIHENSDPSDHPDFKNDIWLIFPRLITEKWPVKSEICSVKHNNYANKFK